jgi:hypothetical protein
MKTISCNEEKTEDTGGQGKWENAHSGFSRPCRQRGAWQSLSILAPIGGAVDVSAFSEARPWSVVWSGTEIRARVRKSRQKEAAGAADAVLIQIEWSEAEVLKLAGLGTEAEVEVFESVGRRIDGGKRWDTGREVLLLRFGLVAFGGVGAVAPGPSRFRANQFLPAGGTGVRFLLSKKEHVNLRTDFAWGKDNFTWSMGVGEESWCVERVSTSGDSAAAPARRDARFS